MQKRDSIRASISNGMTRVYLYEHRSAYDWWRIPPSRSTVPRTSPLALADISVQDTVVLEVLNPLKLEKYFFHWFILISRVFSPLFDRLNIWHMIIHTWEFADIRSDMQHSSDIEHIYYLQWSGLVYETNIDIVILAMKILKITNSK